MATDTSVRQLVVNKLTQAQYEAATKSPTELYLTPEAPASTTNLGPIKVDGTSIIADADGTIHAQTTGTINDGRLTIKRNNVTVGDFTANQATDEEINIAVPTTASDVSAIPTSDKGIANGVATLGADGLVPAAQLPSYVDDVIEAYVRSGATALSADWLSKTSGGAALTPETGKIYVILSSGEYQNKQYRWGGTTYVLCNPSDVQSVNGKTGVVTLVKGDIGLGNVDNTSDADKKTAFTGSIASGNTGFATGGAVFTALADKEGTIAEGTTSQYYRGDKTWQTLNKAAVGLGNVDNTSDATKKTNFTGSIASGNTGFVTGGAAYTALADKIEYAAVIRQW